MNKKNLIVFCAIAAVLILALSIMLISRGWAPQPGGNASTQSGTNPSTDGSQKTGETGSAGAEEQTNPHDTTVPFTVSMGVVTDKGGAKAGGETTAPTQAGTGETTPPQSAESAAPSEETASTLQTEAAQTPELITYEAYLAMSSQERLAYYEGFADAEAFVAWFNAAKDTYEGESSVEIGTGPVDMDEILAP